MACGVALIHSTVDLALGHLAIITGGGHDGLSMLEAVTETQPLLVQTVQAAPVTPCDLAMVGKCVPESEMEQERPWPWACGE